MMTPAGSRAKWRPVADRYETRRSMDPNAMDDMTELPDEVRAVFRRSLTCEFATLTRRLSPVTWPVTPYKSEAGTLDVSTGLTYPAKADRARRNPRVALLFADPVGTGLEAPPVVLVRGLATVRDRDLQAATDRYIKVALDKLAPVYRYSPWWVLKQHAWYWVRAWVEVTPLHISWWPDRGLAKPPREWRAPEGTTAPPSDPAPEGSGPGAYQSAPSDWRERGRQALDRLGLADLSVVEESGWPAVWPLTGVSPTDDGFDLSFGRHAPAEARGSACISFHSHGEEFTGQENAVFVGEVRPRAGGATFTVERVLGDFSLAGNRLAVTRAFFSKARKLRPRLEREVERRGQTMPTIRKP
jgi:hypothetical protein